MPACFFVFVHLVHAAVAQPNLHNLPEVMSFPEWRMAFKRNYANADEEAFRARVYAENVKKIEHHNAYGSKSYRLGVNKFSDLTPEEFRTRYLQTSVMIDSTNRNQTDAWLDATDISSTIDWRTKVWCCACKRLISSSLRGRCDLNPYYKHALPCRNENMHPWNQCLR